MLGGLGFEISVSFVSLATALFNGVMGNRWLGGISVAHQTYEQEFVVLTSSWVTIRWLVLQTDSCITNYPVTGYSIVQWSDG